ncbi:MAG: glutathione S-transferase family protein [Nitrosomonas sp.]|nr:glutathione S-transferase family protein [Nitrosomonas sp.]MDP1950008.1 glutathione S-transferase family protein [Nitrosomonas sp.]
MGLLINGKWHTDWYDTHSSNGEFVRQDSQFRHEITPEAKDEGFKAEAGRYHLFVSLACPWAHRTLILRKLKKLEHVIGVTEVRPEMLENGWEINDGGPIANIRYLHEVYTTTKPDYSGRVTVPVLWDKKTSTIVNNESSEIIRMLNSAFNEFTNVKTDYYPEALRKEINAINHFVYDNINNGVYKTGFATTQKAYEKAYYALFSALDTIEQRLNHQRYLVGKQITETDWRLFTTLIRFDSVYYGHFKANRKQIEDYPNLSNYVRDLFQQPGVADTVNFDQIKTHYYYSQDTINPTRIVPLGPEIDYYTGHNRDRFPT